MTLKDISNGPDGVIWIAAIVLLLLSIVLLSGHGSWLIAGYNTASEEEKSKYDEKKLCRVMGAGMSVITVFLFIMARWEEVLPASFAYVSLAVILAVCVITIILSNTICKK